jgi:UDP-N-acetyl-D-glucosamine dehydrogenase
MAVPLSAVIAAVESAAAPETLVFLESTTYPGTIDDVVRPVLNASGSVAGVDFNLAFSPERFDPGNQEFGPQNTAR